MAIKKSHHPSFLKQLCLLFILVLIFAGAIAIYLGTNSASIRSWVFFQKQPAQVSNANNQFETYRSPKIERKDVYTVAMVGDSMTEALGPHADKLSETINRLYQYKPGQPRIFIDNYAKRSTNILGLQKSITKKSTIGDSVFDPLVSKPFDLILIESFGYNPLSQLGLQEGLREQTRTLDELMMTFTTTYPHSAIIFFATLAPNKETFLQDELPDRTVAERTVLAQERIAYIQNHISYARSHDIPLIDIYKKSLTANGDGDISNINANDHIHPSSKGVDLISQEIAEFIYQNQTLPR